MNIPEHFVLFDVGPVNRDNYPAEIPTWGGARWLPLWVGDPKQITAKFLASGKDDKRYLLSKNNPYAEKYIFSSPWLLTNDQQLPPRMFVTYTNGVRAVWHIWLYERMAYSTPPNGFPPRLGEFGDEEEREPRRRKKLRN